MLNKKSTQAPDVILPDALIEARAALAEGSDGPLILPDEAQRDFVVDPDAHLVLPDRKEEQNPALAALPLVLPHHEENESVLMHTAFEERKTSKYFRLSLCIALYAGLVMLWIPGFEWNQTLAKVERDITVVKRKVLKPPPERPLAKVQTKQRKARKMPVPDMTPEAPEPVIAADDPEIEPDFIETDDWEIGIPDAPPAAKEEIARVGQHGVEPPIIIKRVMPAYPEKAVKVKLEGYVILEAVMRRDGKITDIKVLRQLGMGKFGFEDAAADALRQWQFLPGKVNDQPADVRMVLKVDFLINSGALAGGR